jgi:hypothetical protein
MSKMMLGKDWLWSLFEIVSWNQSTPHSSSYLNEGKHVVATKGRNSWNSFKCA